MGQEPRDPAGGIRKTALTAGLPPCDGGTWPIPGQVVFAATLFAGPFPQTQSDAMNKNDLIEHIAQEYELTKTFARDLVDNVFQTITDSVQKGEEVSLFGFGKFKLVERKARKGRNPQTGEAIKIAASKNVKFEQARAMKALVNTKRRGRK
jgi:DNA-binding protein HU-beta